MVLIKKKSVPTAMIGYNPLSESSEKKNNMLSGAFLLFCPKLLSTLLQAAVFPNISDRFKGGMAASVEEVVLSSDEEDAVTVNPTNAKVRHTSTRYLYLIHVFF